MYSVLALLWHPRPSRHPDLALAPEGTNGTNRLIDAFLDLMIFTFEILNPEPEPAPSFDRVQAHFELLLRRAESFRSRHGFPEAEWGDALFAVSAWVDEKILGSQWEGRDLWLRCPLQRRLFGTDRAGDLFHQRLQQLPAGSGQVREVFDRCLALGFRGGDRGAKGPVQGPQRAPDPPAAPALTLPARPRPRRSRMALLCGTLLLVPALVFLAHWMLAARSAGVSAWMP
jgi:type VI secretion system protein ImpK